MHGLGYHERAAGYTAPLPLLGNGQDRVWRVSEQAWGEVDLPQTGQQKIAPGWGRTRVSCRLLGCVLRPSARVSARCDTLARAGACFHTATTPRPAAREPIFGVPQVHTGAWTPQTGAPVHAGSRLLSAPCCKPCTRRHARPKFEFRSFYNVTCRARARRPGFWLEATAPALPCCSSCRFWRFFDFDRS